MIDVRCPKHPVRLLLRIGRPAIVDGANLIEAACRDCRRDLQKEGKDVRLVLHRYNVMGELVETVTEP